MPNEIEAPAESRSSDRVFATISNPEFSTLFEGSSSSSRTSTSDRDISSLDMSTGSLYGTSFDPLGSPKASSDSSAVQPKDKGEPLGRGLAPEGATRDVHSVSPGETLESIASARLGEQSTARERETFARAIRTINQLGPEGQPKPGDSLKLPVKDDKGNFVFRADRHSMKFYPNGRVDTTVGDTTTQSYPGGRSVSISPEGRIEVDPNQGTTKLTKGEVTTLIGRDGSVTTLKKSDGDGVGTTTYPDKSVEHFTPESRTRVSEDGRTIDKSYGTEGKFKFSRTHDENGGVVDKHTGDRSQHKFTLTESRDGSIRVTESTGNQLSFSNDASLTESRRALMDQATRSITEPGALSRFKADMVRFENRAAERGLASTEVQDTYKAIGRLLTGGSGDALPQEDRTSLASQVISQVATPGMIEQGSNNTCSVASVENVATTTHPSRVAGLIADVATTGQYRASDGTVVKLPQDNRRALPESSGYPLTDKTRSHASQLFQLTTINAVLESNQAGTRYVQDRTQGLTSGERLVYAGTNEPVISDKGADKGKPLTHPNFNAPEMLKAYELVTGEKRPDLVLGHADESAHGDARQDMNRFSTMEEFGQRLEEMKKAGKLPAILAIHAGHQPFFGDAGGSGDTTWHALVISDFKDGMVSIDNQWGQRSDRQMSLKDIYAATRRPR